MRIRPDDVSLTMITAGGVVETPVPVSSLGVPPQAASVIRPTKRVTEIRPRALSRRPVRSEQSVDEHPAARSAVGRLHMPRRSSGLRSVCSLRCSRTVQYRGGESSRSIQNIVAAHYNLNIHEMLSARRSRSLARPRQIAMYLAKQYTTNSLPEIGRKFTNRDHTTVIHAVKKIDELIKKDDEIRQNIISIKKKLI